MNAAGLSPLVTPAPGTARGELRALVRLAGPLVGANLLQMAIAAVDVMFVARLGPRELAAATLSTYLFNLLCYALIGLTGAAAPLIAAELGRRAHAVREVRRTFRAALAAGLLCTLPVMLLLAEGAPMFRLLGQDAAVAAGAGRFLRVLLLGFPFAVAAGLMRAAAAALGRPNWAFGVTGVALLVDILGNWALVFGRMGAPTLGLTGSAVANVLSFAGMALAYAAILLGDRRLRRYRLFGRFWRVDRQGVREVLRLGLPIAVTWVLEGGLFGAAAVLMGLIGVTEIAAHAVALNIAAFSFQFPFGIAQAATIRVGLAYGAGDARGIGRAGNVALALGVGIMALTALLMWVAPGALIAVYMDAALPSNAPVAALTKRFLAVAALFQLADGAQAVAAGVLRGLQDTRVPMLIALFGYWAIGFAGSVALGFLTPLRGVGVWWGLAAGLLAVALLLTRRWRGRARLGLTPG